jgi:hypothetical protein
MGRERSYIIPPPLCYLCFVLSFHCQTLYHYAESGVPVHEQDLNTQLSFVINGFQPTRDKWIKTDIIKQRKKHTENARIIG